MLFFTISFGKLIRTISDEIKRLLENISNMSSESFLFITFFNLYYGAQGSKTLNIQTSATNLTNISKIITQQSRRPTLSLSLIVFNQLSSL